ncbi:toxin-antitoxin system YwqK family antitoxin [Fulvivirga sp. RKSG066]|uniref:toxin-antitoxin system YwqK family antitoxin n=1 Tax=Fulvivirga aurantia TaxID=2529383 RepID=UPI0012BC0B4B|nr:toxin-antitoxin system YwqK family antitoxin [Fulvivirga aurantia]MTI20740.1 toxin-antitoxin system YwqK family antitoxin [Fulvivirga aurantia]
MRNSVFTFVILFSAFACNQQDSFSDETVSGLAELPANAIKEPYEGHSDLVKVTIKNGDGSYSEGDYLDGKKHGSWTEYYKDGLVKSTTSFINGKKQGAHLEISDRGQLDLKSYYHDDKLHGSWVKYNRNRVKEERPYENGALSGTVKIFYDNGTAMEESPYVNGKRHGEAIWYDKDGNETIRYEYKNGELVNKD